MRWVERNFSFDFPVEIYPNIISRLRGAPLRAAEVGRSADPELLRKRSGSAWSAQEHIGHLAQLDGLWQARVDDYLAGRTQLTAWDTTNRATEEAGYNSREWVDVLFEFERQRADFISRLESLDGPDFARTALHPRLQKPMRLIDGLYFSAEHDDHHLARAWALAHPSAGAG